MVRKLDCDHVQTLITFLQLAFVLRARSRQHSSQSPLASRVPFLQLSPWGIVVWDGCGGRLACSVRGASSHFCVNIENIIIIIIITVSLSLIVDNIDIMCMLLVFFPPYHYYESESNFR